MSPYNYCGNSPLIYIDPSGMSVESAILSMGIRVAEYLLDRYYTKVNENEYFRESDPLTPRNLIKLGGDSKSGSGSNNGQTSFYGAGVVADYFPMLPEKI